MGFFGALGRGLAGKEPYKPQDVSQEEAKATHGFGAGSPAGNTGPKTIPVVRLGRIEQQLHGQRVDIYVDIHNEAAEPIFLDRVLLFGGKRELDSQLRAGETKQYLVYSGPPLATEPRGYAEVQYRKTSDGDYFADYHEIRNERDRDGSYRVTEFRLAGPVKDI